MKKGLSQVVWIIERRMKVYSLRVESVIEHGVDYEERLGSCAVPHQLQISGIQVDSF